MSTIKSFQIDKLDSILQDIPENDFFSVRSLLLLKARNNQARQMLLGRDETIETASQIEKLLKVFDLAIETVRDINKMPEKGFILTERGVTLRESIGF